MIPLDTKIGTKVYFTWGDHDVPCDWIEESDIVKVVEDNSERQPLFYVRKNNSYEFW